jgi:muramoyltetrapeptide carboxypeptidase
MGNPIKPPALARHGSVRVISPASPGNNAALRRGAAELQRRGYRVSTARRKMRPRGYFAGTQEQRVAELEEALRDRKADALICARGGYGTSALLDQLRLPRTTRPKLVIGYSDITALHCFLWERLRWTSLYGPMVGAGFDRGADEPGGYDRDSFTNAVSGERAGWKLSLEGETLVRGTATGVLAGGCITLLETTLGTPWELDTRGKILLLEDVAIKPYELDRMLLHLAQAGKFRGVRGIVLGDFPKCDPPTGSVVTVGEVCRRLLKPLGVPAVFGAPVGHTTRPMLTVPLGVRATLRAEGAGKLQILERAVR